MLRKESRGAHARNDYTEKEEAFSKINHQTTMGPEGEIQVAAIPATPIREDLQQIIDDQQK